MAPEERPPVRLRASRAGSGDDPLAKLGFDYRRLPTRSTVLAEAWARGLPLGFLPGSGAPAGLVHATSLAAPPLSRQPLSVTVHDLAWRRFPESFPSHGRRWHEAALARAARHACRFIVPSRLTADDLREALGPGGPPIEVVEEGSDHLEAPDVESARRLLDRLGVGENGYILSVSTLEPRKNLARLVAAYGMARSRLSGRRLVIAGPQGWGEVLRGKHRQDAVLTGPVAGGLLSALYRGADCVAYVPIYEGFGLPAVEAMRSAVPVVASRQLPSSAGAALEVDPTDTAEIAEALVCASEGGTERDDLVARGLSRAASLTWERCARAHVHLWAESLAEGSLGR
jgi:glycosyltransferase involved in cell wall biosynthesis